VGVGVGVGWGGRVPKLMRTVVGWHLCTVPSEAPHPRRVTVYSHATTRKTHTDEQQCKQQKPTRKPVCTHNTLHSLAQATGTGAGSGTATDETTETSL